VADILRAQDSNRPTQTQQYRLALAAPRDACFLFCNALNSWAIDGIWGLLRRLLAMLSYLMRIDGTGETFGSRGRMELVSGEGSVGLRRQRCAER
jgi:hypothetical protein